jgi:anion-transporting  ArsA/GET3 family ATPase
MLGFLQSPMGLADALRVGPIQRQAKWLVDMLTDPDRAKVHLVTLPEEMPVAETLETSQALSSRVGIKSGAIFCNAVYSDLLDGSERNMLDDMIESGDLKSLAKAGREAGLDLDEQDVETLIGYERFLESRRAIQSRHLRTLKRGSGEPVLQLPFLFSAGLALPDIDTLADAIEERIEKL